MAVANAAYSQDIQSLVFDSRKAGKGSLFVLCIMLAATLSACFYPKTQKECLQKENRAMEAYRNRIVTQDFDFSANLEPDCKVRYSKKELLENLGKPYRIHLGLGIDYVPQESWIYIEANIRKRRTTDYSCTNFSI